MQKEYTKIGYFSSGSNYPNKRIKDEYTKYLGDKSIKLLQIRDTRDLRLLTTRFVDHIHMFKLIFVCVFNLVGKVKRKKEKKCFYFYRLNNTDIY